MSEPRHSPPPSARAPKPKGILKNPLDRRSSYSDTDPTGIAPGVPTTTTATANTANTAAATGHPSTNGLSWDEQNIALHDFEKESTHRMKIDEPKTPFVRGAGLDEDGFDAFNLDGNAASSSLQDTPMAGSSSGDDPEAQLLANTTANAGIRRGSSSGTVQAGSTVAPAIGLDTADLIASSSSASSASRSGGLTTSNNTNNNNNNMTLPVESDSRAKNRTQSRSPSFSLPSSGASSRRASSRSTNTGADDSRSGVRRENANQASMDVDAQDQGEDSGVVSEEEDEETRAQREAFARKRNAHYGQEALIAKALAAKNDDDEDDDEEDDDEEEEGEGEGDDNEDDDDDGEVEVEEDEDDKRNGEGEGVPTSQLSMVNGV